MPSIRFAVRAPSARAAVYNSANCLYGARFKFFHNASRAVAIAFVAFAAVEARIEPAFGDIYYNSASPNAGQVIPGTQGITPGPGIDLSNWNSSGHALGFAALDNFDLSNASLFKFGAFSRIVQLIESDEC